MSAIKTEINMLNPSLTSAGTGQQISTTSILSKSIFIEAASTNTGSCYIGVSDATAKVGVGHELAAGGSIKFVSDFMDRGDRPFDLSDIYFDGATTGNKLIVTYLM